MSLKEWLEINNMSVKEMAKDIDVARTHLSRIKNGHQLAGKRVAKLIHDYTNGHVKISELMSRN